MGSILRMYRYNFYVLHYFTPHSDSSLGVNVEAINYLVELEEKLSVAAG
jgi:hypothetical protein